jgi:hypothetical protein
MAFLAWERLIVALIMKRLPAPTVLVFGLGATNHQALFDFQATVIHLTPWIH